jgi:hypothetical protein
MTVAVPKVYQLSSPVCSAFSIVTVVLETLIHHIEIAPARTIVDEQCLANNCSAEMERKTKREAREWRAAKNQFLQLL